MNERSIPLLILLLSGHLSIEKRIYLDKRLYYNKQQLTGEFLD